MSHKSLKNLRNHNVIADKCLVAERFFDRLIGLIGKTESQFPSGSGILFPRCKSVHMWMMRMCIDIVFLKKKGPTQWVVTSVCPNARPWSFLPKSDFNADDALELPAGTLSKVDLRVGDEICTS